MTGAPGFQDFMLEAFIQMRDAYRTVDLMLEKRVRETEERSGKNSCAGCTTPHCCSSLVLVSAIEALYMTRGLGATKWDCTAGSDELVRIGTEQISADPREWFLKNRPCPLLQDGKCTIYPYRPFSCRRYYVWNKPELCTHPGSDEIREMSVTSIIGHANPKFFQLQKWLGWGLAIGPLPLVLGHVIRAIRTKDVTDMADVINKARLRPAPKHGVPLGMAWAGVPREAIRKAK